MTVWPFLLVFMILFGLGNVLILQQLCSQLIQDYQLALMLQTR